MEQTQLIHVTDRRTFKECRRKYRYSIIERLAPLEESIGALWIGSAGHHALRRYYEALQESEMSQEEALQIALDGWKEFADESLEKGLCPNAEVEYLSEQLIRRYIAKYHLHEGFKVVHVEVPITLEYEALGITLQGTLDLIVEYKGHLWIVDHKFLKELPDKRFLEMDDQMTAYIWAARKAGYPVRGAIYNVIRKKLPLEPEPLMKGGLSQRANMDTDYDTYLAAIHKYQLNPEDYSEYLEKLAKQEDTYFHREYVTRNKSETDLFEINLMAEFRDMAHEDLVYYPNPGDRCKYCSYQILCKSENEGGDPTLMKQQLFRHKEAGER